MEVASVTMTPHWTVPCQLDEYHDNHYFYLWWWRGVVVTELVVSTKLLHVEPG